MLLIKVLRFGILFTLLSGWGPVLAQSVQADTNTDKVYEPLRPANLGSPRETLTTFLHEYNVMLDEYFAEGAVTSNYALAAYGRALSTMDFSGTPDGGSRWVQTERLVLMIEVLNRIPLPTENEIPGVDEVEAKDLTSWTIPGTSITLVKEVRDYGQVQWRFSPHSVELLPRYYKLVEELPYKPGSREYVYKAFLANKSGLINREREVGVRLRAANTNSPRSTLEGFMKNMNAAYDTVMKVDKALSEDTPTMTMEEAKALGRQADDNLRRALATLNLSEVPEVLRYDVGIEASMHFKEVFDRMAPPPIDQVPDLDMVHHIRKEMKQPDQPIRWVYPNTAIEIVEVMDGPKKGTFLFSPSSVAHAEEFYKSIKDLPYRVQYPKYVSAMYESAEVSPGFYHFYSTTPGNLVPMTTYWGRLVHKLPLAFHVEYYGQSLWQWMAMIFIYTVSLFLSFLIFYLNRRMVAKCVEPFNHWLRLLSPVLIALLILWVTRLVTDGVNITGKLIMTFIAFEQAVETFLLAWAAFCICRAVVETLIALPQIKEESVDASLLRLSSRILGTLLFMWVVYSGLKDLGLDVLPLVAGLGVGGLAVALAFRPTMENIIGSFMIFADKPYKVGQRVKVLGADGTVEAIGLRSTKIRLLSGHLTTIPNEKMASVVIENIGQRPYIRRVFDITITYDTEPAKINRAVDIIRDILSVPEEVETPEGEEAKPHPNAPINQPEFPPRVYFNHLNSASLNILVIYWYHPPAYWDFLEHANWVNVQIMERFAAEGIDFAFPTQTLHLAGDPNRPLTVGQRWESDEEGQSPLHLFSQAAAFGAHSALGNVSYASASDAIKPEPQAKPKEPNEVGDTTDAPIEEGIMDNEEGDANR